MIKTADLSGLGRALCAALCLLAVARPVLAEKPPVYVAIDAEFGLINSISAQAVERGARVAIAEINEAGGVLDGRKLDLIITDNKSSPARARDNLIQLAQQPDLLAVLCGRFSPVALEVLDQVHASRLILLDPWASADGITDNKFSPNYVFRLSLKDSYAMPAMIAHAAAKGGDRVGLLVPNTGWGRSNVAAAEKAAIAQGMKIVATEWYNWGDRSFQSQYAAVQAAQAQAVLLVANDMEGISFVKELAAMPANKRLPVISHWGVTGGQFVEGTGDALFQLDFSVVQTFAFEKANPKRVASFMRTWNRLNGQTDPTLIPAQVGVGHAYDLVHILSKAVNLAGSTDRKAIRDALEKVRGYQGLVRDFAQPFAVDRHDALVQSDVFMSEFRRDGRLVPLGLK